jgi:hypothetical protein
MSIPNHHVPFGLAWVLLANGDSNPNREIDQLLGYRGQAADEQELVPIERKTPGVKPGV